MTTLSSAGCAGMARAIFDYPEAVADQPVRTAVVSVAP